MLSRRIVLHRSTRADLCYYFINTFAIGALIGWGIYSAATFSVAVVHILRAPEWVLRAAITFATFLGYELGTISITI